MSQPTSRNSVKKPPVSSKDSTAFRRQVRNFYRTQGRHDLPWRQTTDPYRIVVSELMLQQTQVERVVPKYQAFLRRFKSARALARAPLADVLIAWQGLGYNRRAKYLHLCVKEVVSVHQGQWPTTYEGLKALPGIGPYTAGAVMAFAYNQPVPILETNVRTVLLHHFFQDRTDVPESELLACAAAVLDHKNPRDWYAAIMDYGSYLKHTSGNHNRRARSYAKQSKFQGSNRQLRGAIIRQLSVTKSTQAALVKELPQFSAAAILKQLRSLMTEGLVSKVGRTYQLAS